MFKTERMDLILEILHKKKHATIDYLAKHVFASNVTIRRDLKKMEDLGLVIRSYGGVTLMDTENKYVPLIFRDKALFDSEVVCRADHLVDIADSLWGQTFRLFLGLDAVYSPAVQQVLIEPL